MMRHDDMVDLQVRLYVAADGPSSPRRVLGRLRDGQTRVAALDIEDAS